MLSLIYGDAVEIAHYNINDVGTANVRIYESAERLFMGTDTDDIAHVCNDTCKRELINKDGDRWSPADTAHTYVDLAEQVDTAGKGTGKFATIDVVDFDPGDDPYVLCANCGRELLRNDERFEAEFGHPITGPKPWSDDEAKQLSRIARHMFTGDDFHNSGHHGSNRAMERMNCSVCVLLGYEPKGGWEPDSDYSTKQHGPNYAGWARLYVEARMVIPGRWHKAFEAERNSDNRAYAAALERSIATFGVTFTDEKGQPT